LLKWDATPRQRWTETQTTSLASARASGTSSSQPVRSEIRRVPGDPGQGDGGQAEGEPEGGGLAEGDRARPGPADHQPCDQVAEADHDQRGADRYPSRCQGLACCQ
jgi:hypothetical protein